MRQFLYIKSNLALIKVVILIITIFSLVSCFDPFGNHNSKFPLAQDSLRHQDSSSVNFFVLSDWGFTGNFGQKNVAEEMAKISKLVGIKFILTCGDNFQYSGVQSVSDPLWADNFEKIYNDSALHVLWYPALGNHDYYGNPDAEVEYSSISKYWKMPDRYYSFRQKINDRISIRFITLDTQGLINSYRNLSDTLQLDSIKQYVWFRKLLQESTEKWIIVTGHHPVFSASTFHGDTYEMIKLIKPLFDQYKVDFYVCGHDHDFEHTKDKSEYTDYIVTGTGGYPRSIGSNDRTIYSLSSLGFSYFKMSGDTIQMYFITDEGRIGYGYKKVKSGTSK